MESKKNKEDWLTIRIGPELKNQIKDLVDLNKYPDMSTFVIEAIQEKLDPSRRGDIEERIMRALEQNPQLLDGAVRRIGIGYHVKRSDDR